MNKLDSYRIMLYTPQRVAAAQKVEGCFLQCDLLPDQLQQIIGMRNQDLVSLFELLFNREVPSLERVDPATRNGFSGWFGKSFHVVQTLERSEPYTLDNFFTQCHESSVSMSEISRDKLNVFFGGGFCEPAASRVMLEFSPLLHQNRAEWLASSVSPITLSDLAFLISNKKLPSMEKVVQNYFVCCLKNARGLSCLISLERCTDECESDKLPIYSFHLTCKFPYRRTDSDFLYPVGSSVISVA